MIRKGDLATGHRHIARAKLPPSQAASPVSRTIVAHRCQVLVGIVLTAGSASPVIAGDPSGPQDIVVTAEKRDTTVRETPMGITVITSKDLKAINGDAFADIAPLIPGLSYTDSGPGNKRYALRGLQSAGEPEVALYYDEIPVSGLPGGSLDTGDSQPDLKLFDIDRVEVLRGPQGTLYGNGSMGGAIRILSNRPVLGSFQGSSQASVAATNGGDASKRFESMINVPLGAYVAVRVAGYVRREGGWIDDIRDSQIAVPQIGQKNLNDEHTWGGRASILVQPTDNWKVTGIAYLQNLQTGASSEVYPDFSTQNDRYVSKAFVRTPWSDKSRMFNIISTNDFDWAKLTATGSYQKRIVDQNLDTTRYLLGLFGCTEFTWQKSCFGPPLVPADSYAHESVRSWSGEARLVSALPGPLQWTLGAFTQRSTTFRDGQVATTGPDGELSFDSNGDAAGRIFARDNRDTFDQYAVFGEGSYRFAKRLTATVGLRWFRSDRTDQQTVVQQFVAGQPLGEEPFQRFKQSKVFKKFELSYNLADKGVVYIQAAQGFRAGGPNYPGGFNVTAPPYGADSVWDYELGWKVGLLGDKIYIEGSVFDIEWSNLQQLIPTTLFSYIANTGKARSDGFEAQLRLQPSQSLQLAAGVTYNDARLIGAQAPQSNPLLQLEAGDKLANVPDWTANASLTYERPLGDHLALTARVDANYQSERGNSVSPRTPYYEKLGAYALCNLHLGLSHSASWRVGLDVTNLANSFAELSGKSLDANLAETVTTARPRTISLSWAFDY